MRIVLEVANNHSGSVSHLKDIVDSVSEKISASKIIDKGLFEFVFKFQFRDLNTFISPLVDIESNKHIRRFLDTELTSSQWEEAIGYVKRKGYGVQVTPFDEASVIKCVDLDIDDFKIASCSATDWSLLEAVSLNANSVTFSTGGINLGQVDDLYSYFSHKGVASLSILHCCGIYPAPLDSIKLSTIKKYINRYPLATIGYSGHEDPSNHIVALMAFSAGANIIERHVGLESKDRGISLNAYSLSPLQVVDWVEQIAMGMLIAGSPKTNDYQNPTENDSIRSLQRGAIATKDMKAGDLVKQSDVKYAFPPVEGQLIVDDITSIHNTCTFLCDIKGGQALMKDNVQISKDMAKYTLHQYVHSVRGILNESGYKYLPTDTELEISHHYGVENLEDYGCCLVNIINRNYCKKLIVLTAGQNHPEQKHVVKEEYFIMISGKMKIVLDGKESILAAGDRLLIPPGTLHAFSGLTDCIFEEVSTTSIPDDSYYTDNSIMKLKRSERKTALRLHFSN